MSHACLVYSSAAICLQAETFTSSRDLTSAGAPTLMFSKGKYGKGKGKAGTGGTWWGGGGCMGKGKGTKGYGYGDREAWNPVWSPLQHQAPPPGYEGEGRTSTRRLLGRDSMAKKFLRPYAASSGDFLYGDGTDMETLAKTCLRQLLTTEVSELSRRPAYGFSMLSTTLRAFVAGLKNEDARASEAALASLLQGSREGKAFVECLAKTDYETAKHRPQDCEEAFAEILTFLKDNKAMLYEHLARVTAHGALLYVGGLHALDGLIKADGLAAWCSQVPSDEFVQKALDKWKAGGKKPTAAAAFLVDAYKARKKSEAAWKQAGTLIRGDDSDDAADDRARALSSSSSSKTPKKSKKDAKEDEKKAQKDEKHKDKDKDADKKAKDGKKNEKKAQKTEKDRRKDKRKSSSSSEKDKKKKKHKSSRSSSPDQPDTATAPEKMTIHFVSALDSNGGIIAEATDRVHEVKLEDDLTVAGAAGYVLEEQGMPGDLVNWTAHVLRDGKCVPIAANTTPATAAPEVVFVRKIGLAARMAAAFTAVLLVCIQLWALAFSARSSSSSSTSSSSSSDSPPNDGAGVPVPPAALGPAAEPPPMLPAAALHPAAVPGDVPADRGRGWALRRMWRPAAGALCGGSPGGQLCTFGLGGTALPAGAAGQCYLCDSEALQAHYNDRHTGLLTHFLVTLDEVGLRAALDHVQQVLGPEARADMEARCERALRRRDPARPRRGPRGHQRQACVFSTSTPGQAAQVLGERLANARGKGVITGALAFFWEHSPEIIFPQAVQRIQDLAGAATWNECDQRLRRHLHQRGATARERSARAQQQAEAQARRHRGEDPADWASLLESRQAQFASSSDTVAAYDRGRASQLRALQRKFPAVYAEGGRPAEEWQTELAKAFSSFAQNRSWRICRQCARMVPQSFEPKHLRSSARLQPRLPACGHCAAGVGYWVPRPSDVPEPLRKLPEEVLAALTILDVYTGPAERAPHGYWVHTSCVRFSWKPISVEERLSTLPRAAWRRGRAAYEWLVTAEACPYRDFLKCHDEFLQHRQRLLDHGDLDAATPVPWLPIRFMETIGLESAVWPHLYWDRTMCETYIRSMDARRLARAAQEANNPDGDDVPMEEPAGQLPNAQDWFEESNGHEE
ncbi:unnamed protein product, partial [Symbiodinium microadriaticum]